MSRERPAGFSVLRGGGTIHGLGFVILVFAAGLAAGAEEPARRVLTIDEKQQIAGRLDLCAAVDPERERIQENVRQVVEKAAGRDDAIQYVLDYGLANRAPLARMAAIEALGLMGRSMGAAMRKRVLAALNESVEFDRSYSVRLHAARTIAGFGNPDLLPRLYREMPDFDGRLRRDLLANDQGQLQELGLTISRSLRRFETLLQRLEGNDQDLRRKALAELQRLTGEDAREDVEAWRKWWRQKQDQLRDRPDSVLFYWDVNVTADRCWLLNLVELAGLIQAHNAVDGLCYMLDHGSVSEKMSAAAALGQLGGADAANKLRQLLASPDGWVKATAAEALSAIDPKNSAADLRKLLGDWAPRDSSPEHKAALLRVRRAAVSGLVAAGARDAAGRLAGILADREACRSLSWEIVDALRRLGTSAELPALARRAALCGPRERRAALAAIAEICQREPPPGTLKGRKLSAASPAELLALAAGRDAAAGVAAVWELDRRELPAAGDDSLVRGLDRSGTGAARMLGIALLGHRDWTPAVADLARAALAAREDRELACAACATAAEVGSPAAAASWLKRNAGKAGAATQPGIEKLRRDAAETLAALASSPALAPETAAACAEALPALASGGDAALQGRVLAGLIAVLGDGRLRDAAPAACAALRALTSEDFSDEPRYWLRWWQERQAGRTEGRATTANIR